MVLIDFAKLTLWSLCLLYAVSALALAGINFYWIHPLVGQMAVALTGIGLTLAVFLHSKMGKEVQFSWRSVGPGGWASLTLSPLISAFGWNEFWSEVPAPWRIIYTIASTAFQFGFFFCVMLYIMRTFRSIRAKFGRLANGLTVKNMAEQRKFSWHMKRCVTESASRRHVRGARAAAVRRRRGRISSQTPRVARIVDEMLDAYEDSGVWLTIMLLSASLFSLVVNNFTPGPIAALIILIPVVMIPSFHVARVRIFGDA